MRLPPSLIVRNYRGVDLPRTLGFLLAGGGALSVAAVAVGPGITAAGWATAATSAVVLAVGVVDDLAPPGPRGLRAHLRALAAGRLTTGVLKATVITASAVVAASVVPGHALPRLLAAVVLLAGGANLANALDVRPGRALKVLLPVLLAGALLGGASDQPALAGIAIAALPALALDLRERAMLGDGGANLLGYAAALGALPHLGDPWLALAATGVFGLNLLAEARSLSAIIESVPALRALDLLGRRPDASPPGSRASD